MSQLSHIDEQGTARMVNIAHKDSTERVAVANGRVRMQAETLDLIAQGALKKGDVLSVARIAGIQAAKKCWELIPLCHPIMLTSVQLELSLDRVNSCIHIQARCGCNGQTGVEMEALTAVSVAALTLYDMAKAVDRGMQIEAIELVSKTGGKSGDWSRPSEVNPC